MQRFSMDRRWLWAVIPAIAVLPFFQNCSGGGFSTGSGTVITTNSSSSTPTPTNTGGGSAQPTAPVLPGGGNLPEPTPAPVAVAKVCDNGGCLQIGDQELYFTNFIGNGFGVEIVSAESVDNVIVNLKNWSGRNAKLKLSLKSNGYVQVTPYSADSYKYMSFTRQKTCDAMVGSEMNCSATPIVVGTKQKVTYDVASGPSFEQLYYKTMRPGADGTLQGFSTVDKVVESGECLVGSCIFLPNIGVQFVLSDLHTRNDGLKIVETFSMDTVRRKITVQDSEGRSLSFIVRDVSKGPNTYNFDYGLFDERDHGYLCFDHRKAGLAKIVRTVGGVNREMVNCFASVRYNLVTRSSIVMSGVLSFVSATYGTKNTSLWSINDDAYFTEKRVAP